MEDGVLTTHSLLSIVFHQMAIIFISFDSWSKTCVSLQTYCPLQNIWLLPFPSSAKWWWANILACVGLWRRNSHQFSILWSFHTPSLISTYTPPRAKEQGEDCFFFSLSPSLLQWSLAFCDIPPWASYSLPFPLAINYPVEHSGVRLQERQRMKTKQ